MKLRIASWNINSARLRVDLICRFLRDYRPDILLLQEIKCLEAQFPVAPIRALGWHHIAIAGQKAYHGVAALSRRPLSSIESSRVFAAPRKDDRHLEARHLSFSYPALEGDIKGDIKCHNFYVPAGGDIPDAKANPKFGHKLDFLKAMRPMLQKDKARTLIVGDLNIAPEEQDVWSHRQMLKVVSHTPEEVRLLRSVQKAGGFLDAARFLQGNEKKLYSWWSYRARDWRASDRGRRLDHIWLTPDLAEALQTCQHLKEVRDWQQPSDHVPVMAEFRWKKMPAKKSPQKLG